MTERHSDANYSVGVVCRDLFKDSLALGGPKLCAFICAWNGLMEGADRWASDNYA
jgi:hypothetical protein